MAGSSKQLKILSRNSRALVTLAVAEHGPVSKAEIAKITGLGLSCVNKTVRELIEKGELREGGTAASNRGRPAAMIEIDRHSALVAGVWIGPESIEVGVAGPGGELLVRRQITYEWEPDSSYPAIGAIVQGIRRCASAAGGDAGSLRGVGVTVAGITDPAMGVIENVMHRTGWEGVPIVRLLRDELGVPVYLDADIRGVALFHHWFSGEGRDGGSCYLISIEGIGAAFVLDQELVHGSHDGAGQVGHVTIDPNGPSCPCGSRGCLELFASDLAFIRNVWSSETRIAADITASERIELVGRGVELAKRGDPHAVKALRDVTRYLAAGIANIIRTLDPRTVFFCGTLADVDADLVLDMIRREVMQFIHPRTRGVEIVPLRGFEDYLLRGAIGLVLWQPYRRLRRETRKISAAPRNAPASFWTRTAAGSKRNLEMTGTAKG